MFNTGRNSHSHAETDDFVIIRVDSIVEYLLMAMRWLPIQGTGKHDKKGCARIFISSLLKRATLHMLFPMSSANSQWKISTPSAWTVTLVSLRMEELLWASSQNPFTVFAASAL